jgi:hypothetical protein
VELELLHSETIALSLCYDVLLDSSVLENADDLIIHEFVFAVHLHIVVSGLRKGAILDFVSGEYGVGPPLEVKDIVFGPSDEGFCRSLDNINPTLHFAESVTPPHEHAKLGQTIRKHII